MQLNYPAAYFSKIGSIHTFLQPCFPTNYPQPWTSITTIPVLWKLMANRLHCLPQATKSGALINKLIYGNENDKSPGTRTQSSRGRAKNSHMQNHFWQKNKTATTLRENHPLAWSKNFDSVVESGTHPPQTDI